jgi:hypothetical protein
MSPVLSGPAQYYYRITSVIKPSPSQASLNPKPHFLSSSSSTTLTSLRPRRPNTEKCLLHPNPPPSSFFLSHPPFTLHPSPFTHHPSTHQPSPTPFSSPTPHNTLTPLNLFLPPLPPPSCSLMSRSLLASPQLMVRTSRSPKSKTVSEPPSRRRL